MAKDKYDFIQELLGNNKLKPRQRERVLMLVKDEIKKDNVRGKELKNRVQRSEQKLKINENITVGLARLEEKRYNIKHKPKQTKTLLSNFSSTDGGIKNLTHSFNYGFIDYDKFIKQCKEEFIQGKKNFPDVPNALLTRIEQFAFANKPAWFIRKGKQRVEKHLGWSEEEFVFWYKTNQTHPANNAKYNDKMIIPFKESIQVRADTGNLIRMIEDLKFSIFDKNSLINVNVSDRVKSAQFYTDVDNLGQAIYHIFIMIKHMSVINFCDEVDIDYKINNNFKELLITHIDSKSNKDTNDFDFIGGDMNGVKNSLWGLCNYDIAGQFLNGCYRKVILSDNINELEKKKGKWAGKNFPINCQDIKGFTHVLKFY